MKVGRQENEGRSGETACRDDDIVHGGNESTGDRQRGHPCIGGKGGRSLKSREGDGRNHSTDPCQGGIDNGTTDHVSIVCTGNVQGRNRYSCCHGGTDGKRRDRR